MRQEKIGVIIIIGGQLIKIKRIHYLESVYKIMDEF